MFILATDVIGKALNLTSSVVNSGRGIAGGLTQVGIGIGSIMLLFCTIYYVSTILDGGHFQLKMLWPLVIYIFAANFTTLVASPTISFTTSLTKVLVKECKNAEIKQYSSTSSAGNAKSMTQAYWNHFMANKNIKASFVTNAMQKANSEDLSPYAGIGSVAASSDTPGVTDYSVSIMDTNASQLHQEVSNESQQEAKEVEQDVNDANKTGTGFIGKWIKELLDKFKEWFNTMIVGFCNSITSVSIAGALESRVENALVVLLACLMQFVCDIMSILMVAFGAVMTAVIVAFGPITFGFAVFPGMGRNIGSWFIRLIQFSLYAPICALVNAFSASIFNTILTNSATGGGMGDFAAHIGTLCGMLGANIVLLCSVPTIASLIVEGASGGVSFSQGWHSFTQGVSTVIAGGTVANALKSRRASK